MGTIDRLSLAPARHPSLGESRHHGFPGVSRRENADATISRASASDFGEFILATASSAKRR